MGQVRRIEVPEAGSGVTPAPEAGDGASGSGPDSTVAALVIVGATTSRYDRVVSIRNESRISLILAQRFESYPAVPYAFDDATEFARPLRVPHHDVVHEHHDFAWRAAVGRGEEIHHGKGGLSGNAMPVRPLDVPAIEVKASGKESVIGGILNGVSLREIAESSSLIPGSRQTSRPGPRARTGGDVRPRSLLALSKSDTSDSPS